MTRYNYRVVTGWYPSRNTANKIYDNVKAKFNTAEIRTIDGYYTVVIKDFCNIDEALTFKLECLKRKVFCGIEVA